MFENRYEAIGYWRKELYKADDEIQAFLIRNQKIVDAKVQASLKYMAECRQNIKWNYDQLRLERGEVEGDGFSFSEEMLGGESDVKQKRLGSCILDCEMPSVGLGRHRVSAQGFKEIAGVMGSIPTSSDNKLDELDGGRD